MTVPVFLLIAFILEVIALFLINAEIKLEYILKNGSGRVILHFMFLWRVLDLKYKVRMGATSAIKGPAIRSRESIFEIAERLFNAYRKNKALFKKISNMLHINELDICIHPATGCACTTAILSGFIWAAVGSIDSLLTNHENKYKKNIMINPEYSGNETGAKVICIFAIKPVNIIIIAIAIKRYLLRKK